MGWRVVASYLAVIGCVVGMAGCGAIKERRERDAREKRWEEREKELARSRVERETYERQGEACAANDQSKCEALHASCMSRSKYACYLLTRITEEVLAANPKTFDGPSQYRSLRCFEHQGDSDCESLSMRYPPEPIELGVPGAERDFGAFEDHCDEGADACYQTAINRGRVLEGCSYGCGDLIKNANAILERAYALYLKECSGGDAVSCYKLGLWDGRKAKRRARHSDTKPEESDKIIEFARYFDACKLGLYDACSRVTYEILLYQDSLLVNASSALKEELLDMSARACALAPEDDTEQCEAHIVLVMRYAGPEPDREAIAKYAESIGASAAYDSIAYWKHPAWRE